MSFLPNTVTMATIRLHKKNSIHKWHWIVSFLVSFYRVKCKNYYLYTYMDFHWLYTHFIFSIERTDINAG